jgi:hypothetical protein
MDFSIAWSLQPHYDTGIYSASNGDEDQESAWGGKARPAREANNLIDICEQIM